ncbi:MAG: hypothetical protein ACI8RD_003116 [Bacillariaceae sp.]|jgi:hypothetical protein
MLQPSDSFSESVFQRSSLPSLFKFVVLDDLEEATRPEETECTDDDLLGQAFIVVVNSSSLESESSISFCGELFLGVVFSLLLCRMQ